MTGIANALIQLKEKRGKLIKLTFVAYPDNTFDTPLKSLESGFSSEYSVMINPSSVRRSMSTAYDEEQAMGQNNPEQKFKFIRPETWSFDFIIDGTGIATGEDGSDHSRVDREIKHFMAVVYDYHPKTDSPPFVLIRYVGQEFQGVLTSLNISYDLFYPDGLPLRAKITCSFSSVKNAKKKEKVIGKNSSNLTLKVTLKENETLAVKSCEIYGSDDYYIVVARTNDLNNFRKIEAGTQLYFPPLKSK